MGGLFNQLVIGITSATIFAIINELWIEDWIDSLGREPSV